MIVVAGLSHRTAPIAVREHLAIARDEIPELLREAVGRTAIAEAFAISTCNRFEMVAAGDRSGADVDAVAQELTATLVERAPAVGRHLYCYRGAEAVRHLFRVAASLDSLVLGEPQILGQLKDAFELARDAGTVGPVLNRTVPRAVRAAKKVRTETSIGSGQVSVPSVAVDLARQIFGDLERRHAALVGSGEMAEAVARLLTQGGATLSVVGRTPERVAELTRSLGGEPKAWNDLGDVVAQADVVISSTSAPHAVIDRDLLDHARKARRGRSLFLIDLAVPRDVDPRADSIDGVFLYNIDDFSRVVAESVESRQREAEQAERIVQAEVEGFDRWAEAEQLTPTIVALRARVDSVVRGELERSLRGRLKHLGEDERAALAKMGEAIVNKLLHAPTARLREIARDSADAVALLTELFDVDLAAAAEQNASGERTAIDAAEAADAADGAEGDADVADDRGTALHADGEARATGTEPR